MSPRRPRAPLDPITILLPVADQVQAYLDEAIESVMQQRSGEWRLLVGVDQATPLRVREWLRSWDDPRIRVVEREGEGFAAMLNHLMEEAETRFCGILLSDDRLAPSTIETVQRYRHRYPRVDFFHSGRQHMDAAGRAMGEPHASRPMTLDYFTTWGSPVKHFLCWRRAKALEVGGMRAELSRHGCDDYDFPWRMAEAGAAFRNIDATLYEYRIHGNGPRLTNDVEIQGKVDVLARMFALHEVPRAKTATFLQKAVVNYLTHEYRFGREERRDRRTPVVCWREVKAADLPRFLKAGFKERHVFPHRLLLLHRAGSDGVRQAERMCGFTPVAQLRELLLFATDEALAGLPLELFFDPDIAWHGRQLGRPGLVGMANLVVGDQLLTVTQLLSDVAQRMSRRRELKTRVESSFRGWAHMLVNGILDLAADMGVARVRFATAARITALADPSRAVDPTLFRRLYDETVRARTVGHERDGWWWVEVADQEGRCVPLARRIEARDRPKVVCVSHDMEWGIGHLEADPAFARECLAEAQEALPRMLEAEAAHGVRATYNVVGSLWDDIAPKVVDGRHALGFHSFEHVVARPRGPVDRAVEWFWQDRPRPPRRSTRKPEFQELVRCRGVDDRIPGYRPPQSRLTTGLHEQHLAYFNFVWLANSAWSLGLDEPRLERGIVKIPVHLDDHPLYEGQPYEEWEEKVIELVRTREFASISLHDCYARFWIDRYPELLGKLAELGETRTFDEVADEVLLTSTRWV